MTPPVPNRTQRPALASVNLWQPPAFEILLLIALLFGAIASLHCHSLLPLATSLMVMLVANRKRRESERMEPLQGC